VLVTLGKVVTEKSALAAYSAVERFIAAHGPHSGITDLSGVEELGVSADFVWKLAAKPPMIPDGMVRIAVAPRPGLYGMGRMFQMLRENRNSSLEVVRSLQEAFNLLGLSDPHFTVIHPSVQAKIASQ
jgi:hypothetical protein